jgi:type VI secretion system ImpM family protein
MSILQPKLLGWFGKIAALGDFVARRLPSSFVQRWDDWLANEIGDAQDVLGDAWPEVYLAAPLWCFELAPGTVDADRWHGVVFPSVDRVGRRFPLTIAASGQADPADAIRWWAAMAGAARCAQDPGCDAQGLDDALEASFKLHDGAPDALPADWTGLDAMIRAELAAGSRWWRWPPEGLAAAPPAFTVAGLPHGSEFMRLFLQGP